MLGNMFEKISTKLPKIKLEKKKVLLFGKFVHMSIMYFDDNKWEIISVLQSEFVFQMQEG